MVYGISEMVYGIWYMDVHMDIDMVPVYVYVYVYCMCVQCVCVCVCVRFKRTVGQAMVPRPQANT